MTARQAAIGLLAAAGLVTLLLTPGFAAQALPPNELGRIMILEYHRIESADARWARSSEGLRQDLLELWGRGYRLVALADVLNGRIALPAGSSPVVLTFDDSSPGQFRYLPGDGEPEIDPECAVGILEAFAREHPGFGRAATFYVLPGADPPNRLFDQPEHATRKLRYLASHGYEIGNHTLWHADLSRYPERVVRQQLAEAVRWIQRNVPGYEPRTLALPMGNFPAVREWAIAGEVDGVRYRHDGILTVAGGAAPSPHAAAFDPYRIPRIQAIEPELRRWLGHFDRHPEDRYVSDGDPTTVTIPPGRRAALRPGSGLRVIEHEP